MRNRVNTPPRDEASFITGGTAGIDKSIEEPQVSNAKTKAKPVSISFSEDNLKTIDQIIRDEMMDGNSRVNRSDVIRAAITALINHPRTEVSELIKKSKLK